MSAGPVLCAATGCRLDVKRGQLMCKAHWLALPNPLRDRIWETWRAFNALRSPRSSAEAERQLGRMGEYREAVRAAVAYLEAVPTAGGQQAVRSVEVPAAASRRDQIDWVYEQRKRDIVRLYTVERKTSRQIGAEVRLSHVRVLQILAEAGVTRRRAGPRAASADLAARIAEVHPEKVPT